MEVVWRTDVVKKNQDLGVTVDITIRFLDIKDFVDEWAIVKDSITSYCEILKAEANLPSSNIDLN